MSTAPIRVVIADDHPVFRNGLASTIRSSHSTELTGAAADGAEAIALTVAEGPHVVLMDVRMPGINGIDAAAQIVSECPGTAVLMLTMFDDDDLVFSALRSGARGYILKESTEDEILHAIVTVASGGAILGPGVAGRLQDFFATPVPPVPFPDLTSREREILELIAAGRPNAEIARHFTLSEKTVRNYVSNILNKLHVAHRTEAIVRAREAGMGIPAESQRAPDRLD
jgi:DNA-binding NarL/FixJ family response regulator